MYIKMDKEYERRQQVLKSFRKIYPFMSEEEMINELAYSEWKFTGKLYRKKSVVNGEQDHEDKIKFRKHR